MSHREKPNTISSHQQQDALLNILHRLPKVTQKQALKGGIVEGRTTPPRIQLPMLLGNTLIFATTEAWTRGSIYQFISLLSMPDKNETFAVSYFMDFGVKRGSLLDSGPACYWLNQSVSNQLVYLAQRNQIYILMSTQLDLFSPFLLLYTLFQITTWLNVVSLRICFWKLGREGHQGQGRKERETFGSIWSVPPRSWTQTDMLRFL